MQIQMYKYCVYSSHDCRSADSEFANVNLALTRSLTKNICLPHYRLLLFSEIRSSHLKWNSPLFSRIMLPLPHQLLLLTKNNRISACPSKQCPQICWQCRVQSVIVFQSVIAFDAQIIVLLPLALFGGKSHSRSDKWTTKYWMIRKKAQEPARDSLWGVISWSISYGWPNVPFQTEHEEGWQPVKNTQ